MNRHGHVAADTFRDASSCSTSLCAEDGRLPQQAVFSGGFHARCHLLAEHAGAFGIWQKDHLRFAERHHPTAHRGRAPVHRPMLCTHTATARRECMGGLAATGCVEICVVTDKAWHHVDLELPSVCGHERIRDLAEQTAFLRNEIVPAAGTRFT